MLGQQICLRYIRLKTSTDQTSWQLAAGGGRRAAASNPLAMAAVEQT
jgi:hypothetical protein